MAESIFPVELQQACCAGALPGTEGRSRSDLEPREETRMNANDYASGYRFGLTYGRTYGVRSLLGCIRRDAATPRLRMVAAFIAGEIDAALELAQASCAPRGKRAV